MRLDGAINIPTWGQRLAAFYMISTLILFYSSVLSNKLDAPMLNGIIAALGQEIVPQGNCQFQCKLCVLLKR